MIRNTQSNIKRKEEGATQPNVVAPKMGMTSLRADGGVLPVSGVTEWVINGNEGTTDKGLFLVFFFLYICLVFSTGEKSANLSIQVTVLLEKVFIYLFIFF